ncbi:hypothetical protein REH65_10485 [Saccharopolyspora sp. ID03-671]|uniref:hypothetical protein n=1 Tax=Saccharopolyspora sp. ID03-671 TaxID=3073066 RepID=UPI003247894D
MTELRALASPGDDGVRTTLGPLARFRVQAARRASGRVLDIGARRLSDLPTTSTSATWPWSNSPPR